MPIIDRQDATDVHERIDEIFQATSTDERTRKIRVLLTEILDFERAIGVVGLESARANVELPRVARRVANLEDVQVVYVDMAEANTSTNKIRKAEASEAARLIHKQLGGDQLMVFTNRTNGEDTASLLQFIYPDFVGRQPTLRRMIVERDLPRRTAVQQVSNIYYQWENTGNLHDALTRAFDVEAVTRQFFTEYKRIFNDALSAIRGLDTDEDRRLFTQTLFNRLMFVYFLSRKGWLTFDGDKDYLNALWASYKADEGESNFYSSRLDLLFFCGLNSPGSRDLRRGVCLLIGDVPFLNGGLFERNELDNLSNIIVPDEAIEPLLKEIFNRFNFTVMESTPFDIEVAVDPEMLGKVFEELVTSRHASGSYYTPRPVVSFMCREALKGYLASCHPQLSAESIAAFVDYQDTSALPRTTKPDVALSLDQVTVVDPACGSGAYLLGMMQEIIMLRDTLFNEVGDPDPRDEYQRKLHIISHSLYGVDKDEFAANIAMLRLWLSLAIEYDGDDDPPPLPNLDFKVVCGDSLPAPDPSPEHYGDLFSHQVNTVASQLGYLKNQYMQSIGNEKNRLREEILRVQSELTEILADSSAPVGAVDWRAEFPEVFSRGGFNIVVANPPYVRQEDIKPGTYKKSLTEQYTAAATARSDLYCYFYARGLQLLADGGMHIFVCSNSWLDVGYGARLQGHLLKTAHVQAIYESAVERQFSTADINTLISVIRKTRVLADSDLTRFVSLRDIFDTAMNDAALRREIPRKRSELQAAGMDKHRFVGDKWGGKYLRAPNIYHAILNNYGDKLARLGDVATVRRGITTGANNFFYLTTDDIDRWGIEPEYRRPVMTTPQESRSIAVDPTTLPKQLFMCHEDRGVLAGTGALAYIEWGEAQGYHNAKTFASKALWWNIGPTYPAQLGINTLIDTTARTFYCQDGLLFDQTCYTLSADYRIVQLCAVMNCTLSQLMINVGGRANFGGGLLRMATYEVGNLPIVNPLLLPEPEVGIFNSADWDVLTPSAERRQIDDAVHDALGLTADERKGVYEGVIELVDNRKRRARSV